MGKQFAGTVTWVGHSTFLIESPGGKRILVEAFVDNCPTTPDALKGDGLGALDAILITHGHADHVADVFTHQSRTGATVACMVELAGWLTSKGMDAGTVIDFNKGGTIDLVDGIRVTMVHAFHSASNPDGGYAGEPAGFVIELEDGYRIYHAGDTMVFGDMALIGELWAPDLALLPIGGHYTMDPRQAAKAVQLVGATDVIGMHWGTFPPLKGRPAELAELLGSTATVHALQPGESWGKVAVSA